jgi:hypothetical protein
LAKDNELFNYDFCSDEEWEDEGDVQGEDIDQSDGEDEAHGEDNDLVYDDFFRHDDDARSVIYRSF